ncbi:MAG: 16S rRNA (guanine(527)-N(7))-methyltransferase RsmG [Negativicutes bacterium]|jgi:16S rRNA (guanine527-N7)-methyltransferase
MEMIEILNASCIEYGIELTDKQLQQFNRYYELLIEWNEKINLTAITEPADVAVKHFVDSLTVAELLPTTNNQPLCLIDVGSGAGFPGIPLKIIYPQLKLTLLDSLNKRLKFLQTIIDELELTDVILIHGRAEEVGRAKNQRECYDIAVARAVARLNVLCELCLPFVKRQGLFIAQKGAAANNELLEAEQAIKLLGGKFEQSVEVKLPGLNDLRSLIVIKKIKNTPDAYPRQAGTPERKPL